MAINFNHDTETISTNSGDLSIEGTSFSIKTIILRSDPAADLATGDGMMSFTVPSALNGMDLKEAQAAVYTVSSSGLPTIQIRNQTDTVDMLTTRITIDETELNSYTAAASHEVNTDNDDVATGDILQVDVDVAGTGTKGLDVILTFGN